jgi:uncharacterized protein
MSPTVVKCPTCQRELDWEVTPSRPFCSERCRLIDLGAWLAGERAIAGEAAPSAPSEPAEPPPKGFERT